MNRDVHAFLVVEIVSVFKGRMDIVKTSVGVFPPWGVTPTSKFVCVLPFPDGDAKRYKDLSWFGQEKAPRPAGGESLYYLAPKCLYRGEYKRGMDG